MKTSRIRALPPVDVLLALTYYAPYVSGLTNVARDVAEGLAARGLRVRVVTGRHDPELPTRETLNGVDILRAPVLATFGKGTISPAYVRWAIAQTRLARVLNLHLPMLEAGVIARLAACPVVVSYHCDVALPPGPLNDAQRRVIDASSTAALRRAVAVVVTSEDYARSCRVWPAMAGRQREIPAPCQVRAGGSPAFRRRDGLHVGFLGRIVAEKGIEYLVDAVRGLPDPEVRLLIGGDYERIAGGSVVDRVRAAAGADPRIELLGFVPEDRINDFYASLDVFALPSVNSFEAFGIVQVEAMMAGVPAVASNLPGVRTPVQRTGFGAIAEPRDPADLRRALVEVRDRAPDRVSGARRAEELYSPRRTLEAYRALFAEVARAPW